MGGCDQIGVRTGQLGTAWAGGQGQGCVRGAGVQGRNRRAVQPGTRESASWAVGGCGRSLLPHIGGLPTHWRWSPQSPQCVGPGPHGGTGDAQAGGVSVLAVCARTAPHPTPPEAGRRLTTAVFTVFTAHARTSLAAMLRCSAAAIVPLDSGGDLQRDG